MYIPSYPKKNIWHFKTSMNYDVKDLFFFKSASNALNFFLKNTTVKKTNKIFLPSLICKSVSDVALHHKLTINFYDLFDNLKPNILNLNIKKGDIVLIINYFGFNLCENKILKKLSDSGVIVIIDNAHMMFTPETNKLHNSNAKIFSLWKNMPLSEGGILVANELNQIEKSHFMVFDKDISKTIMQLITHLCFMLRINWVIIRDCLKKRLNLGNFKRNNYLKLVSKPFHLPNKLKFYNAEDAKKIRVANYNYLVSKLKILNNVHIMFKELPIGSIPLTLPISVKKPKKIKNFLRKKGIDCFMWPGDDCPKEVNISNFSISDYWHKHVIHVPVQQDLKHKHLDLIVHAITHSLKS